MSHISNQVFYIFLAAISFYLLYMLSPILTPFLLGALLAYLANPLVKRLERWHIPHLLSVISIFLIIFSVVVLLLLMLIPIIENQIIEFINEIPQFIAWLQQTLIPWIAKYVNLNSIKAGLSANAPKPISVFDAVLKSGYTIIEWVVNIVLTPVVTFYLLRDWDKILKVIKDNLLKSIKANTIKFAKECDEVLSAFFKGQLLVMLSLCFIYGVGLTLVGLQVGFIIGLIGGLLSIVPYVGSIFVVIAASIAALVQYGNYESMLYVLGVYLIGQVIESYVLTPYLVGNRIGLHPVAVIFAIMAGGTLFGFFGVLVALPAAAMILVMLRFIKQSYS